MFHNEYHAELKDINKNLDRIVTALETEVNEVEQPKVNIIGIVKGLKDKLFKKK